MTNDIVLITDDSYVLPTMVCIASIAKSLRVDDAKLLNIHVCTFGLSDENCKRIEKLSNQSIKVVIDTIDYDSYDNKMRGVSAKTHVSKSALLKFELANIFSELETLLYLDSDIVIKDDISELLKMDISDYFLAASFEYWARYNNMRYRFGISKTEEFYFNSGVMLLNLKKMRENEVPAKLWDYKVHKAKTSLMDQESLNEICGKRVKPLSITWNFNPVFYSNSHIQEINHIYSESFKDCEELLNKTRIIHYVGKSDKPWNYSDARLKEFWIKEFEQLSWPYELSLKTNNVKELSLYEKIKNIVETFGISGVASYMLYLINVKMRAKND